MKRNSSKTKPGSNRDGFTLVELVVVIAVLAILAGVGAVAYNGYIEYAKKGVDRQTVGEIMHALELADYADPGLFGDNAGAMVVLSTDGINAAGGLKDASTTIEKALEDAFGDLKSTKLSFDNWKGTADMSVFAGLGEEGSYVNTYLDKTKDGEEASFARDIDELWEAVQDTLQKMGDDSKNRMQRVVKLSTEKADEILNRWKSGQGLDINTTKEDGTPDTVAWFGASHSRNYAFYMYAKSHCTDWDKDMQDEIDALLLLRGAFPYYNSNGALKDARWTNLINSYTQEPASGMSQAEIDAMAYLGMMEAAKAVGDNNKDAAGYVSDGVYLSAFEGYVGMVGNILTKATDFKAIKELAGEVAEKGNVIVINATKLSNGTLKFSVSPEEATPREKEIQTTITYNTKIEIKGGNVANGNKGTLVLSLDDVAYKVGTVTTNIPITSAVSDKSDVASVTTSGTTVTITAVGRGNAVVTIQANSGRDTYEWTVNVNVN